MLPFAPKKTAQEKTQQPVIRVFTNHLRKEDKSLLHPKKK
jgi:hypothetical protein